jgi:hypothetical protein
MWKTIPFVALLGCTPDIDFDFNLDFRNGTPSEQGFFEVGYAEGCPQDFLGGGVCPLSGPILAGSRARLSLWTADEDPPRLSASVADESIAHVAQIDDGWPGDLDLVVVAQGVGTTFIELRRDGEIYDRVKITIAHAKSLAFFDQTEPVLTGAAVSVPVVATDADGQRMFGRGAIAFHTGAELTATADYDPDADLSFEGTDHVVVIAGPTGKPIVGAAVPRERSTDDATAEISLDVVDAGAAAKVAWVGANMANEKGEILALFQVEDAAGRAIRGAHCGIAVQAAFDVDIDVNYSGVVPSWLGVLDWYKLSSKQHGPATFTCAFGAQSVTEALQF